MAWYNQLIAICPKAKERIDKEILPTHQGYFPENALFIADNSQREARRAAFEEFFSANQALNDQGMELLDEEFDAILASGVNFKRELNR